MLALLLLPALTPVPPPSILPPDNRRAVYEAAFEYDREVADPLRALAPTVTLRHAGKVVRVIDAFWDGGRTWRVRFRPDAYGEWTGAVDWGDGRERSSTGPFSFFCGGIGPSPDPLQAHGLLSVSADGTHFVHADGTPFFWLADTAWNGVLRSTPEDWDTYLAARSAQKFTAVQFVATPWRGGDRVLDDAPSGRNLSAGETDGRRLPVAKKFTVDPEVFRRLDAKVRAINEHGLVAAPVLLWALGETDPGEALPVDEAVRLGRYLTARWGVYSGAYLLGGDGKYRDADRWRKIGRGVFPPDDRRTGEPHPPVTLHMAGRNWLADPFADGTNREPWFDFVGYQSGHGEADHDLRWLTAKQPATWWREHPGLPVLNLEPNYEGHPAYGTGVKHTPQHVRRAAWWSLLVAPTAGVTYGHNAVWVWNDEPGPAENHGGLTAGPWTEGLDTGGTRSMTVLREFFENGPWPDLRPAPDLIANQPDDPEAFIAAAATADGTWAVIYSPVGQTVTLSEDGTGLLDCASVRVIDPATGEEHRVEMEEFGTWTLPADHDWVIELRAK